MRILLVEGGEVFSTQFDRLQKKTIYWLMACRQKAMIVIHFACVITSRNFQHDRAFGHCVCECTIWLGELIVARFRERLLPGASD